MPVVVVAGGLIRSRRLDGVSRKRQLNQINEAKKRVYFYYWNHNEHALWMGVLLKLLVSTTLLDVWSTTTRSMHCTGARGRHAATAKS